MEHISKTAFGVVFSLTIFCCFIGIAYLGYGLYLDYQYDLHSQSLCSSHMFINTQEDTNLPTIVLSRRDYSRTYTVRLQATKTKNIYHCVIKWTGYPDLDPDHHTIETFYKE